MLYAWAYLIYVAYSLTNVYCSDELLVEKERVRNLTAEIEQTVQEIQGS